MNNVFSTKFGRLVIVGLTLSSIFAGMIFGFIVSEVKNFSGIDNLKQFQPSVPTRLYDINGELISELFKEKRDIVSFDEIPRVCVNAFIATEDQAFYQHFGINYAAIFRAMIKNIMAGKIVQGGSTITQQLAKRLFTEGQKTFGRKAFEAILALQIEKKFTKEEILEMYFNQIYLGHGCYGISSASSLFFNKQVKYLSAGESSVLAALPSAPGRYSPLMNTRDAYEKNRDILNRMVREKYLTREYSDKIYQEFWPKFVDSIKEEYPTKNAFTKNTDKAPFFSDWVRQILVTRFGEDVVYKDGLSVYTTLDLRHQEVADKVLREGVVVQDRISSSSNIYYKGAVDRGMFSTYNTMRMIFSLPGIVIKFDDVSRVRTLVVNELIDSLDFLTLLTDSRINQNMLEDFRGGTALDVQSNLRVEGAFISVNPRTGHILSLVGGSNFNVDNQFNRALQARRQPGSSFKPFVYGAAIDNKVMSAGDVLSDAPILNVDEQGVTWSPGNYGGKYSGLVSIKKALAQSINIIAVRIFDIVGPDKIIEFASKMMKIPPSRFSASPSMSLGVSEMTPLEMATAYSIYANSGRDVIPFPVRYVQDRDGNEILNIEQEVGEILAVKQKQGTIQIIPESTSFIMNDLMKAVFDVGTARNVVRDIVGFNKKCAGKTGTTSNWTDAWMCGFTPDVCAIVWVGYDKPFLSLGKGMTGSYTTGPIWAKYMKEVYSFTKDPVFPDAPDSVYKSGSEYYMLGTKQMHTESGGGQKMKSIIDIYMEQEGI